MKSECTSRSKETCHPPECKWVDGEKRKFCRTAKNKMQKKSSKKSLKKSPPPNGTPSKTPSKTPMTPVTPPSPMLPKIIRSKLKDPRPSILDNLLDEFDIPVIFKGKEVRATDALNDIKKKILSMKANEPDDIFNMDNLLCHT
jgi:hypothetical protein